MSLRGSRRDPTRCRARSTSAIRVGPSPSHFTLSSALRIDAGPVPQQELFIANTDRAWFDYLTSRAVHGVVDEVNFWSPRATRPMKRMLPGEPIFFRLKNPDYAIAGYGFFAEFSKLTLRDAWDLFAQKNGDPSSAHFYARIAEYRSRRPSDLDLDREDIGCNILREAHFLPESRWIPWSEDQGWSRNIVQGRTESEPARVKLLLALLQHPEHALAELAERFEPLTYDDRLLVARETVLREGQGTFRLRMLRAYDRQCAITGEHTEPVLDAAHIQPYLGPASNHVQNGLVLTKEFHALFDRGYVSVTPDYKVRVSDRLRDDWKNGRRYFPYKDKPLVRLPDDTAHRPSRDALEWHYEPGRLPYRYGGRRAGGDRLRGRLGETGSSGAQGRRDLMRIKLSKPTAGSIVTSNRDTASPVVQGALCSHSCSDCFRR